MIGTKKIAVALVAIAALFALVLSACDATGGQAGTTTLSIVATLPGSLGAPSGSVLASVAGRAVSSISIPVEYPAGTAVGTIELTAAQVVIKEVEFEEEGEAESDGEYEFEGPFLADFILETITPEPVAADLPAGTYTQVKFKIDKVEGDEEDSDGSPLAQDADPIFGHSIYLEGTYTPTGGSATAFTYTFDLDAEFELSGSGDAPVGFDISATQTNSVLIAFRLARWFDGIDPAAFAADPGSYAEDLKENIKMSADYGKDDDGDGELQSSEDDDPDEEDESDD